MYVDSPFNNTVLSTSSFLLTDGDSRCVDELENVSETCGVTTVDGGTRHLPAPAAARVQPGADVGRLSCRSVSLSRVTLRIGVQ